MHSYPLLIVIVVMAVCMPLVHLAEGEELSRLLNRESELNK